MFHLSQPLPSLLFLWAITHSLVLTPHRAFSKPKKRPTAFSFHLLQEPYSLDPAHIQGTSGSYLFNNIYRSLYRYRRDEGLVPELAKTCQRISAIKMKCQLNPLIKYSDGTKIKAQDFVFSFKRLLDPKTKSVQTELLLSLKNAKDILKGIKSSNQLGVKAQGEDRLIFEFDHPDSEFEYKLTNPTLSPLKSGDFSKTKNASSLITSGPYLIQSWSPGQKIILQPNPHYPNFKSRPPVQILIVEDHTAALNLYRTGQLQLLRRVSTDDIPFYKNKFEYKAIFMNRFDYIGFGKKLDPYPRLKEALAYSLKYKELQKLYHSVGVPGCPSLNSELLDKPPCYRYDLNRAKKALAQVPKEVQKRRWKLQFSKLGGDDHLKGMQWIQNQWKQNLGLNIDIEAREQGMYLQDLKFNTPDIFRKGVAIDRPTCLAALEVFDKDSRENYIRLKNVTYQKILNKLKNARSKIDKKLICTEGVRFLMDQYFIIPMGEMYFSLLATHHFKGWEINELNQLDLTSLKRSVDHE